MGCRKLDTDFFDFLEVVHSKKRARGEKKCLNVYPFGLQHKGYNNVINGTENNYQTYQGKEDEKELGKNTYAFGWRDYDPAIGRFNKIDRFAEKYYAVTPYHFSANNPIFFREINGDSIQGVSRKSARRTKREIRKTFKNNKKLARLFKTKGKKFKGISQSDFDDATKNSSADEKALANGYFEAVNSSEIHTVEAVKRGEKFSNSALSDQFGYYNGDGKINGADADDATGGGFNFKTGTGTHTVIVTNSTIPITDYRDNSTGARVTNRTSTAGELLAHELLGHGLTNYNAGGNQFLNAIQLTNLYQRVTTGSSRFYRDGSRHGGNPAGRGVAIPGTISWQVQLYLK
ncbi:RHS repeat-associated core domain-containing protein [Zunongwangia pacifica]|uniref:RHS repeat-associated core domain-containing protein n=1 Tax=Zunongwangia pacifica TaxID=2911062 RepID=A0A9X2A290_9FLAO|nr:RHS repeat-associated core domain-containing protein [Zunongwangia pacifica]MCL6220781.1 hypothetical protein [Zunongwangia pacifica]